MTTDMMQARVKALKLHGLLAHWEETRHESWVSQLLQWEEEERSQRGLNGRLKSARIGRFKPMANFDWAWPKKCDREAIEEFMNLAFTKDAINIILCGPNGVGKSTIARNIAYQGYFTRTYRFIYYCQSHVKRTCDSRWRSSTAEKIKILYSGTNFSCR